MSSSRQSYCSSIRVQLFPLLFLSPSPEICSSSMHLSGVWIFLSQISVCKSQMLTWAHSFFSHQTCPLRRTQGVFPGASTGFHTNEPAFCIPVPYSVSGSSAQWQHFSCSWSFLASRNLHWVRRGFYFIVSYPAMLPMTDGTHIPPESVMDCV